MAYRHEKNHFTMLYFEFNNSLLKLVMRKIVSYGIDFSILSYSQESVWTHRDLPTKLGIKMDVDYLNI